MLRNALDSSKVFGPNCIPVVLLSNCKSDLSYALADLFSICSEEYYFPDCGRVLFVTKFQLFWIGVGVCGMELPPCKSSF